MKINNSIKLSFTGLDVDCITNTLHPLTVSLDLAKVSPSANLTISLSPSFTPNLLATFAASFSLEEPAKTLIS